GALGDAQRRFFLRIHIVPHFQRAAVRLGKADDAIGNAAVFGVGVSQQELGLTIGLYIQGLLPPVGLRALGLIDQSGIGIVGIQTDHTDLVALHIELPGKAGLLHLAACIGGAVFQLIRQREQGIVQLLL